ncbi:MAG: hypothetical protein ACKPKO_24805, partial [Candidatus Fonsibacter sp.]
CQGKFKAKGQANPKGNASDKGKAKCVVSKWTTGWDCIQPSQPIGKPGSQTVKYHLNALVAKKN